VQKELKEAAASLKEAADSLRGQKKRKRARVASSSSAWSARGSLSR